MQTAAVQTPEAQSVPAIRPEAGQRLVSLDAFRGFIMFVFAVEWGILYWMYRRKIFLRA